MLSNHQTFKRHLFRTIGVAYMFLSLVSQAPVHAQRSETELDRFITRVRYLYSNSLFVSAEEEIFRAETLFPLMEESRRRELDELGVMCAINLGSRNIEALVAELERKYPESSEIVTVKFMLARHLFDAGDFASALKYLDEVEPGQLHNDENLDYLFDKAFCCMRMGRLDEATAGFEKLLSLQANEYTARSSYYLAWIHYMDGDFETAMRHLEKLEKGEYSVIAGGLMVECLFMTGQNEKAAALGDSLFDKLPEADKGRIAKILSSARFALHDSEGAQKYFEIYRSMAGDLSNKDHYYAGIVLYSLKQYPEAVAEFANLITLEDSLGQNANYQMANAYVLLKNRVEAKAAYYRASHLDFDHSMTEESLFQYAKLTFDLDRDITAFNSYLERYPSSSKSDEVYNYISAAYLLNNQYAEALEAMAQISSLNPVQAENYQKAAFFQGMWHFRKGAYNRAMYYFRLSQKYALRNQSLNLLTQYWMGETYYRMGKFQEAVGINTKLLSNSRFKQCDEYKMLTYNLGYDCFSSDDYAAAFEWFTKYLAQGTAGKQTKREAELRMADCKFMLREYTDAAGRYAELAESSSSDLYPAYQAAVTYGLLGADEKKVNILKDISVNHADNSLYSISVYELGRTYTQLGRNTDAQECWNLLMRDGADSLFKTKALLESGMLAANEGDYDRAVNYYREVINRGRFTEDAASALAGMESACQMNNRPDIYISFIDSIGMSELKTADEKELMVFSSAEQLFLSERYSEAESALHSFVRIYPDGSKTSQALFYLGDLHLKLGKREDAADFFKQVMERRDPDFSELSSLYYARICFDLGKFKEAASAYRSLLEVARLGNNMMEANLGLMKSYFMGGDYADAIDIAEKIITLSEQGQADLEMKIQALYYEAKALSRLGKRDEAQPILAALTANPQSEEGAEAAYLLIQDAYDRGEFETVANRVYALSDSRTSRTYWLARSFIVLGDSFAEQGDMEQAEATFRSIAEGYHPEKERDDIIAQVNMRLSKLKK